MPNKTKYIATSLAAVAILSCGIYLGSHFANTSPTNQDAQKAAASPEEIAAIRSIPKPQAPKAQSSETPNEVAPINALAQLNDLSKPPLHDILVLEHLLAEVHTRFHELPTGEHDEIVAFLQGDNPLQLAYFTSDNPNLNEDGKIIDRWGTPFFFHTLSRHRIEVRSAGPDHLHWSEDDVISETVESQKLATL